MPGEDTWADELPKTAKQILSKNYFAFTKVALSQCFEFTADAILIAALSRESNAEAVSYFYRIFIFSTVSMGSFLLGAISDFGRRKGQIANPQAHQHEEGEDKDEIDHSLNIAMLSVLLLVASFTLLLMPIFYYGEHLLLEAGPDDADNSGMPTSDPNIETANQLELAGSMLRDLCDHGVVFAFLLKWGLTMPLNASTSDATLKKLRLI